MKKKICACDERDCEASVLLTRILDIKLHCDDVEEQDKREKEWLTDLILHSQAHKKYYDEFSEWIKDYEAS